MRNFKKFGVLAVVVFALSAIGAANASAATFTASATGTLSGSASATQVFTTNAGQVKCNTAETSGNIVSTASNEQHVTVVYKNCTAFGFANVHISPATYLFTSNGQVHIKNTITINVTIGGCHQTVAPQTVGSVDYASSGGKMTVTPTVAGISYSSTGGLCGSAGSNGTYSGANSVERVGGGTLTFDP